MKQVEIIVDNATIPLDIYQILYELTPSGFVERRENDITRFIAFVDDIHVEQTLNRLKSYPWIRKIIVGSYEEKDSWLSSWKENYKPIVVSPFKIIPAWLKDIEDTTGYVPIYINSGIAFGTGEHETTRLCLRLLSTLDLTSKHVLDIGTGSGILAIAAGKLGSIVDAFDIDPVAVEVAKENVIINDLADRVTVFKGDAFRYRSGNYDVVMANLVWSILSEIPYSLKKVVDNGFLIVSGILKEQFNNLLKLYSESGFKYIKHIHEGEWVGVLFRG